MIERLLEDEHLRLGCNISAQSAIVDPFWSATLAQLRDAPAVAARLVIEITESATPPSTEAAIEFVLCLRELGCRVAVDDFGAGLGTLEFIRQSLPDMVKIDQGYLQRARSEPNSVQTLKHLVQLCKTLAPCVIIEGIESEADRALATACGGEWGQGYLFGRPRLDRLGAPCRLRGGGQGRGGGVSRVTGAASGVEAVSPCQLLQLLLDMALSYQPLKVLSLRFGLPSRALSRVAISAFDQPPLALPSTTRAPSMP